MLERTCPFRDWNVGACCGVKAALGVFSSWGRTREALLGGRGISGEACPGGLVVPNGSGAVAAGVGVDG